MVGVPGSSLLWEGKTELVLGLYRVTLTSIQHSWVFLLRMTVR